MLNANDEMVGKKPGPEPAKDVNEMVIARYRQYTLENGQKEIVLIYKCDPRWSTDDVYYEK